MARITVRNMAKNLIDPREMFQQIDPKKVSQEVGPIIRDTARKIVEAIAMQYNEHYWRLLPQRVKDELVEQVSEDTPDILEDVFQQFGERFEEVFSIEDMCVKWLVDHKRYLVNMFVRCGWRELCLIRNNGAVMGFVFGMIQLVMWIFYPEIWVNEDDTLQTAQGLSLYVVASVPNNASAVNVVAAFSTSCHTTSLSVRGPTPSPCY
jgi:hypothetical protein